MPIARITEYLDQHRIKYQRISHSPAYTAQEVAARAHVSGWDLAKTVVVKLDDGLVMAVLPASELIDLGFLAEIVGSKEVSLATEEDFMDLFPGCELGAIPAFGNLYGLKVYVAPELADDDFIFFSAGSHTELIRMAYDDFELLVEPELLPVAVMD